jgi:glycosyltransferase involved in cell wall biosynthesis
MHILLIHQAFTALDQPGGTRHHELAGYLAGRGHRVTVVASPVSYLTGKVSPASPPPDADEGVVIRRARTYNALHRSFVHRVLAFVSFMLSSFWVGLRVRQVDVVWGTSPPIFQGLTAWTLARLKRAKFLFEVRDLWPDFAVAVGVLKNPLLMRMSYWLERFLYRRADRVLVNSPGYVDHVLGRGARAVDLIPNGADPAMFDPDSDGEAFRKAHHLEGRFVVLYAGAHGLSNDLGVVLGAAQVLEEQTGIHFVMLGDGKEKPVLQRQAAAMGLSNLTFLPPLPKNEMGAALAGADACIAILKPLEAYKTTYPNKVFDYMAAGRPVVLAIEGVIRDLVEQADCGVYPRPGDPQDLAHAVAFLAADREHAAALGRNGRRYLEAHFSRQVLAGKLEALLREMLGAR